MRAGPITPPTSPRLLQSLGHSLFVASTTTAIVLVLAFTYAYALTRSCMPGRGFFKAMALVPLLKQPHIPLFRRH